MTLYLRENEAVPFTHHAHEVVAVSAIDQRRVREFIGNEPIEITCCQDTERRFLSLSTGLLVMDDGKLVPFDAALLPFAFAGGGRITVALENPLYDEPITLQEFERREEEEAAAEAQEALDW